MNRDDARRYHERVRVDVRQDGAVAWLVMERGGGAANAFDEPMVDAMAAAIDDLPEGAGCLVLRGEEEFSVGADLAMVRETPPTERPATIEALADASNQVIRALRSLELPVVAAVNGTAAGGGLGFALACDLVVMHAEAVLDPAYARIGLTPDNSTPFFLARTLGPYRARELLFDPRPLDAEAARSLGLSVRTFDGSPAEFDDAVGSYAAEFARYPASVHGGTKTLVDAAYVESLEEHLERERETIGRAADSAEFKEGLAAFFEGRDPEWGAGSGMSGG